jgi:flagellar basal body-associated protein FliL
LLDVSLPKVYPFASDKNLLLTLEEQMKIQEKNIKETEKNGSNLSKQGNLSATRPVYIILAVALSILLIVVILLAICLIYRCRRDSHTPPTSVVNIGAAMNKPTRLTSQPKQEDMGSLYDLLQAFAVNKADKT